jgi:hypothetical protein
VTAGPDPKSEPERGLYLYGIAPKGAVLTRSVEGVDPTSSASLLELDRVDAIVSEVSLDEFGPEALKTNLNELGWLEACARAHEKVLEEAVDARAILPARLATVYSGAHELRRLLEPQTEAFATQLEELDGKREWGVKAFVADAELVGWLEATDDDVRALRTAGEPGGEGAAYLARKKYEMHVRARAADVKAQYAEATHAALIRHADRAQLNPLLRGTLATSDDDLILNGAYLVARPREEGFLATARELEAGRQTLGMRLEVTGPWPPYNFVTPIGEVG